MLVQTWDDGQVSCEGEGSQFKSSWRVHYHQQPLQKSKGLDNLCSRVPTFAWDLWDAYRSFPKFWAFDTLRPLILCWGTERLHRMKPVSISSSSRHHSRGVTEEHTWLLPGTQMALMRNSWILWKPGLWKPKLFHSRTTPDLADEVKIH